MFMIMLMIGFFCGLCHMIIMVNDDDDDDHDYV